MLVVSQLYIGTVWNPWASSSIPSQNPISWTSFLSPVRTLKLILLLSKSYYDYPKLVNYESQRLFKLTICFSLNVLYKYTIARFWEFLTWRWQGRAFLFIFDMFKCHSKCKLNYKKKEKNSKCKLKYKKKENWRLRISTCGRWMKMKSSRSRTMRDNSWWKFSKVSAKFNLQYEFAWYTDYI